MRGSNKLVRDKIPAIIEAAGERPTVRTLSVDEYKVELFKKLVEEAQELLDSKGDIAERADLAEVLASIDDLMDWSVDNVTQAQRVKRNE